MAGIYPRTIYRDAYYGAQQTSYSDLGICKDYTATAGYCGGDMTLFLQAIVAGIGATVGVMFTVVVVATGLWILNSLLDDRE